MPRKFNSIEERREYNNRLYSSRTEDQYNRILERSKINKAKYVASRKIKAFDYLGGKCVVCGTIHNLEFDHIDPETKSFNIGKNYQIKWDNLCIELDKCQLLCEEHHKQKHYGAIK